MDSTVFFLDRIISPCGVMPLLKGQSAILKSRYLENYFIFFSNYCRLQIWTLKICNQDILKSIIARSFELGQLIEDDE